MNIVVLGHRSSFDLKARNQTGVNMVDLMMWLVIASLLLATAIQSIAYYQRGVYVYTLKTALEGAGSITMVRVGEEGRITKTALDSGVSETKRSDEIVYTVATPENGAKPYIVASHPAVPHVDGIYLFESCGDTYPIGVSMIPKGGTPVLEACGVTPATEESGGSTTPPTEESPTTDTTTGTGGDTTTESPTTESPTTGSDTTTTDPNSTTTEPDSSTTTPTEPAPAQASCSSTMTIDQEAKCWGDFIVEEEISYETRTGLYFGINWYEGESPTYDRDSLDNMPLTHREEVDLYRDASYPDWDYNYALLNVLDRDGDLWQGELHHYFNQPEEPSVTAFAETTANVHYHCDNIYPTDLFSAACRTAGIPENLYRVKLPDNDNSADADIAKVINAQYAKLTGKTGSLYGNFNTVTDVTSWAATTNQTKVWNEDTGTTFMVHISVASASGDKYHARYRFVKNNPSNTDAYNVYRYTTGDVNDNCTRPIVRPIQYDDIPYCQMAGYTAFK